MQKPTPKRQLAVTYADPATRMIFFSAVPDVIEDIRSSGLGVLEINIHFEGRHLFRVDPLYDFDDVLKWIKSLDPDSEVK